MTKRGKILRDPFAGPGLVMAEGRQYLFEMDLNWRSTTPPRPGLVVDLELSESGTVQAVFPVSDWRPESEGRATPVSWRYGISIIVGVLALAGAWWFLPAFSVESPLFGRLEFSLWDGLGLLNLRSMPDLFDPRQTPGVGIYGVLVLISLAGPFLPYVWADRRALLAGIGPLLLTAIVGLAIGDAVRKLGPGSMPIPGSGIYVGMAACVFMAVIAIRQFAVSKPFGTPKTETFRKAA